MPSILQPVQGAIGPDFLAIGHVARDMHPNGSISLGGTATFAALTAYRLGVTAAIVTCAAPELFAELPRLLPAIGVAGHTSAATTTFANSYQEGFRTQYLRDKADELQPEDVPEVWRDAPIVLLGPVAQELTSALVKLFPRRQGAIIAATPQGWLRRWDADGRIWPIPWTTAKETLPLLDVLILSHDDLLPFAQRNRADADTILASWSLKVPVLVATDGRRGATLFQRGMCEQFPAYPAIEVDPTGAGDVFAAAFLVHLYRHGDARTATDFANCVAALSIEHQGTRGIPKIEAVNERRIQHKQA